MAQKPLKDGTPKAAIDIITKWKSDKQIRKDFKSLSAYSKYCEDVHVGKCIVIGSVN